MPVSLCEWRVRIGRFVHSVREYVIRERKEKLLMERIRRLKLLHKRLLEKGDKSEDKCESNQNELSAKVDNDPNKSSIIDKDTPTNSHKEDSCSKSESTNEENTTNHKSIRDDSAFPFFFTMLLSLFSLLFSLIFFFVVDISNLIESSKYLLNFGGESTWRNTCLRIIVCSSLAYIVLLSIINTNEDVQDHLVLIGDEKAKVECIIKANKTPTESTNKENNTAAGTTIKSNISPTESNNKENNTQTESAIRKNYTSRIKEKNATTESTKEYNNIPTNATMTESSTPSTTRDGPSKSKQSETKTSKSKTIKEKNTTTELTIRENSTLPESTTKDNITPKECHIDTSSFVTDKPSKRKTSKKKTLSGKKTPTESIFKDNNTPNESTIEDNNTKTESNIKDSNTPITVKDKSSNRKISRRKPAKDKNIATASQIKENTTTTGSSINERSASTESTLKYNIISTESTVEDKNTTTKSTIMYNNSVTESTIKDKVSRRKISKKKTTKYKNTATKSKTKGNTTTTESTIKDNPLTESTMKDNKSTSESPMKDYNSTSESTIIDNTTTTESTIKEHNSSTKSTIKDSNTPNKFAIKDDYSPAESTVKKNKSKAKYVNKGSNSTIECTLKNSNTQTKSIIKDNNSKSESTIKEKHTPTESTIKVHNTTSERPIKCNENTTESTIKDRNSTTESTIKDYNRSSGSTIKYTEIPMEPTTTDYNAGIKFSTKDNTSNIQCSIKEKNTPFESTIKEKNTPTESPIKSNNSTSESAIKDCNTTHKSAIKENDTSSRTHTKENSNQSMKVNIAQAEYTIRSGIQKVLSNGKHGISSRIPSSLKGTTDYPVMQESTCLPEMILVKAGDVEQNPGPFDRSTRIQEKELVNLAYDVPVSKYAELCIALGVAYNHSQFILNRHHWNVIESLIEIFCVEWMSRQRDGTDCRNGLAAALRYIKLDALGDKMSGGGYLPQEAAPTGGYLPQEAAPTGGYPPQEAAPTASIANEKNPLTTEQVTQCSDDFKTFYRTHLFKIKTDPLNFSLVFEFERIYTAIVLLRNEQGTTKKIPLDYNELLKTKVNEELPKRLMVEGEGGAGKTTFCSKMAWDWTKEADDFQEFDWVLVIPLRDIERDQTIGDIARTYLSDSNSVQPHQIDEYILANPSKVFIILDGLDEYDGDLVKQGNDIAKIIRSEKFQECRVLVTTRPWKVDQIKSNAKFMNIYAFIAVAGFDKRHISIYINKYFADDSQKSRDLVKLIENNDVIQENMAPFPIYIAMLCILWRDSDSEKRELIRRLKTFSQLFQEIIISLKDHYVSKQVRDLDIETVTQYEQLDFCFSQIGEIALSGIMEKKLVYGKDDFSSCEEAMETCCRVGVLSHETRLVRRQDRHTKSSNIVRASVFFPHKLFQEYFAGMYLASLFESDHEQYQTAIRHMIPNAEEFRYLLYFTASQSKNVAIDVTNRLKNMIDTTCEEIYEVPEIIRELNYCLVDIVFEAFNEDVAKMVGQQLFAEQKSLIINEEMSAHTVSGYLFIMEKIKMETLILTGSSCGPTVSRDLADVICSSTALTALELSGAKFHDDFYGILESEVNTSKVERLSMELMKIDEHTSCYLAGFLNNLPMLKDLTLKDNCFNGRFYTELASGTSSVRVGASGHSVRKLHLNHRCHNDILQHGFTVKMLFPNLEHLYFTTLQTVSPNIVGSFAHSGLTELSFATENSHGKTKEDEECHVPLVGDPSSLEQVFLNSFLLLTNLSFNNLVIGNNRCKKLLSSLKQHQHLEKVCVIHCYTDEEIDPIVSAINLENRMKVKIQHDKVQRSLKCMKMSSRLADALCHRTSIQDLILMNETTFSNAWFSEENHRTIDSKIEKVCLECCDLYGNDPTASRDLATFLCLLPCLTDLTIKYSGFKYRHPSIHNDLYYELARLASSSKIEKVCLEFCYILGNDPTTSRDLAKFLCLLPCLTDLTIKDSGFKYRHPSIHKDFYYELARLASSSKIEKVCLECCDLNMNDPTASRDLAKFLCLLPCLSDLTIKYSGFKYSHPDFPEDFYHELAHLAQSSKIERVCIDGCNLLGNDPTASRDLAKFLCILPCLTDLTMKYSESKSRHPYFPEDFYNELAHLAQSSKIEKVCIDGFNLNGNDRTASRYLAEFLCLLPCLTDLTIKDSKNEFEDIYFHDDFYHEIARLASSSKIQKVCIDGLDLFDNDPTALRDLAKFLCLLPCLTDLTMENSNSQFQPLTYHDDFYHEIARCASSSKIEQVCIDGLDLRRNDQTASRDLAKFLCLLPCLTDLTIKDAGDRYRRNFYHELARLASSSKIEKVCINGWYLRGSDSTASSDLATFLCLLPCLTDVTIRDYGDRYKYPSLHEDFYHALARLASSSKVEKVCIDIHYRSWNDPKASRDLAKFLWRLPCLTDLTIKHSENYLYDDFYHEIDRLASFSKNPFFTNNKHRSERILLRSRLIPPPPPPSAPPPRPRPPPPPPPRPPPPGLTANLPGRLPSEQVNNQHGTWQHQDINRLSESVVSLESSVTQQSIGSPSPGPVQIHGSIEGEQYTSQAPLHSSHEHRQPLAHCCCCCLI